MSKGVTTPLQNCTPRRTCNGVGVFDTLCQITRAQSARNSFRRQHIGEHCPFKLNTSQHCSVEFNPRNGEVYKLWFGLCISTYFARYLRSFVTVDYITE